MNSVRQQRDLIIRAAQIQIDRIAALVPANKDRFNGGISPLEVDAIDIGCDLIGGIDRDHVVRVGAMKRQYAVFQRNQIGDRQIKRLLTALIDHLDREPVSYTHLTLPTIYSV